MSISGIFNKDPKKSITNHVKQLEKLGLLPEYWRWNKSRILEFKRIDEELIKDLNKLHDKHIDNPEAYAKIMPILQTLHKDLEYMQKQQNFAQDIEKKESSAVNNLIQTLSKQTWNETLSKGIFSEVKEENITLGGIAGTVYTNNVKNNGDSVLILTGILASRKNFELLAKRIAFQGYTVLVIDLPSQGDSQGDWRLGLMCDFIFTCVDYLRKNNSRRTIVGNRTKVSIIGHSAGAVASMFAALGYSQDTEKKIYSIFEKYSEIEKILVNIEKEKAINEERAKRVQEILKEISSELNRVILESLRNGRFSNGEINSFILLAPPPRFQEVMPRKVADWIGSRDPKKIKKVIDNLINKPLKYNLMMSKNPVEYSGPEKEGITWFYLNVPETKEFMEYISNIKNPVDYVNIVLYFEKKSDFIRHYLDRIVRPIPKLYIYGRFDSLLKGFTPKLLFSQSLWISKKRQVDIELVYSMFGSSKTFVLPNSSHFLNDKDYLSINLRNQMIQDPAAVRLILQFLERH